MSAFITIDDESSSTAASAAVKSVTILTGRTRKICVGKNYTYLINSEEILSQATQFLKPSSLTVPVKKLLCSRCQSPDAY